jgi:hypothetical protein
LYSLGDLMSVAPDSAPLTIAGHTFTLQDRTGDLLNLRVALGGASLVPLARALARLDGVRITGGPEGAGSRRGYIVHCLGFKMVLSAPLGETADFALALVSRTPQAALAVMSDLGTVLERLMSEPSQLFTPTRAERYGTGRAAGDPPASMRASSALRRSALQPGKPLRRKTELRRKTPLGRGRFRRS